MNLKIFSMAILASLSSALPPPLDIPNASSLRNESDSSLAGPIAERSIIASNCDQTQKVEVRYALKYCNAQAEYSDYIATRRSTKIREYFKTSDKEDEKKIAKIFRDIAVECGEEGKGRVRFDCYSGIPNASKHKNEKCTGDNVAYSIGSSQIVLCPKYFDKNHVPARSTACHKHDQVSYLVKEMTKLPGFGSTFDYNAHGYKALTQLKDRKNMAHSDTYALFLQAVAWEARKENGQGSC